MPSFSSGIPLLGLVHGEGKGEAISSSWPVWVGTLLSSQFLEFWFLFLPLALVETLFYGLKTTQLLPQDKNWSLTIMQQSSL
jgi:hypothetical protein